jgi:hypothetical protein
VAGLREGVVRHWSPTRRVGEARQYVAAMHHILLPKPQNLLSLPHYFRMNIHFVA